jgi:hypothetical protein
MRASKVVLASSVFALCACGGGQPRIFKVAINQTALEALVATCYRNSTPPTDTVTTTNGFVARDWTLWDGVGDKQYLDVGVNTWQLGHANPVQTGGASSSSLSPVIEGSGKVFSQSKQINKTASGETDVRALTITFTETPGATAMGTINLKSTYTCAGCGQPSCEANLDFSGRKVEGDPTIIYAP